MLVSQLKFSHFCLENSVYPVVSRFVVHKPAFNMREVPLLSTMLYSSSPEVKELESLTLADASLVPRPPSLGKGRPEDEAMDIRHPMYHFSLRRGTVRRRGS